MGKPNWDTRVVRPSMTSLEKNRMDFYEKMSTGLYDMSRSFISSSGAYVAYMKGHNYHEEEIEVAKALADTGLNVVLTPEGDGYEIYATNFSGGTYKYSEGTVSQFTFEQKTPDHIENTAKQTVRSAIKHANTKRSQIALIYDRYSLFSRDNIEEGMKYYQQHDNAWRKKVKAILVVNSKREVWEHQFDDYP